jgi:hypothetical protein
MGSHKGLMSMPGRMQGLEGTRGFATNKEVSQCRNRRWIVDRGEVRSAGSEGGMVALLLMRSCLVAGVGEGFIGCIPGREKDIHPMLDHEVQCVAVYHG